jgi:hypothetical protein
MMRRSVRRLIDRFPDRGRTEQPLQPTRIGVPGLLAQPPAVDNEVSGRYVQAPLGALLGIGGFSASR